LKEPGRKPTPLTESEVFNVSLAKSKFGLGAVNLETILTEQGAPISHNRIHHILKANGLAKTEPKKSKRRKWVRWERRHSNSLWHTDWFEYKGKQYILYEDDASRFITGYGQFLNATAGLHP
jgi:putative transposase